MPNGKQLIPHGPVSTQFSQLKDVLLLYSRPDQARHVSCKRELLLKGKRQPASRQMPAQPDDFSHGRGGIRLALCTDCSCMNIIGDQLSLLQCKLSTGRNGFAGNGIDCQSIITNGLNKRIIHCAKIFVDQYPTQTTSLDLALFKHVRNLNTSGPDQCLCH